MRNFLFVLVLVIIPMFIFTAMHLQQESEDTFLCTGVTGKVFVQHEKSYSTGKERGEQYHTKSKDLPLVQGMKIGPGDIVKTQENAIADILLETGLALRIKQNSWVKLTEERNSPVYMQAAMKYGKVLAKVSKKLIDSRNKEGRQTFKVKTPTAIAGVRGTSFMVRHPKGKNKTTVAVKKGLVRVSSPNAPEAVDVPPGKKVDITKTTKKIILKDMSKDERKDLGEVDDLKSKVSALEKVDQAVDLGAFRTTFDEALIKITEYEMAIFVSAMKDFSRLKWDGNLPDSLRDVELDSGDYEDPWDTEYLYQKLGPKEALLISAGPDKVMHSRDDIFKPIQLY